MPGSNSEPFQTGWTLLRATPRIATSGAFTIGVKFVPPMPPKLEIVKQAPLMSAMLNFLSRAFAARLPISVAISATLNLSASLMTGTTKPFGVSTAIPML